MSPAGSVACGSAPVLISSRLDDAHRSGVLELGRVGQVILLSLAASLNPTLVAATTVMLLLPDPAKLMTGYLLGALMTSITLGLVIVFTLSSSGAASTTENTLSPAADIALGAIALIAALVLCPGATNAGPSSGASRRRQSRTRARPGGNGSSARGHPARRSSSARCSRSRALPTSPAWHDIHKLDYSTTVTVLLVIGFNLVMLWLLEVPLVAFLVAPNWTPRAIDRAKVWVSRHAHALEVRGLSALGALLIIKGIIGFVG